MRYRGRKRKLSEVDAARLYAWRYDLRRTVAECMAEFGLSRASVGVYLRRIKKEKARNASGPNDQAAGAGSGIATQSYPSPRKEQTMKTSTTAGETR